MEFSGTAHEKIPYAFIKYAAFNFTKPVFIVLMCKNEILMDYIFEDKDFINLYAKKNIYLIKFSDIIKI